MTRDELLAAIKLADELLVRKARDSFTGYCKYIQPADMQPVLHHLVMAEALNAVVEGSCERLMVCLPPGAGKSTFTSILAPQYFLGRNPQLSVIQASHTAELAERFGRRVRNAVAAPEFQRAFPGVSVAGDNAAAGRWATNQGGEYTAFGVGGSITGMRADCLLGNSKIQTLRGEVDIQDAKVGDFVLSLSEQTNSTCYRRISAVARRSADRYFRVQTSDGSVVEATGNHRFFVNGVWREASAIVAGDILLRVLPKAVGEGVLRAGEKDSSQSELSACLRPELRHKAQQLGPWDAAIQHLQPLLRANSWRIARSESLLGQVQDGDKQKEGLCRSEGVAAKLRNVWLRVSTGFCEAKKQILLGAVSQRMAAEANVGGCQSNMEGWLKPKPIQGGRWPTVQARQEAGLSQRWIEVLGLRFFGVFGGASHRHERNAQRADEYCDAVQGVPYHASCGREIKTESSIVSLVTKCSASGGVDVYDIEVDETHCFFANGVLVHNCAFIDDPVRSREDADSERVREKTWDWYVNDFLTRLKPGGRIAIACTRWHEDDLMGRILDRERDKWKVIKIPMIAGPMDLLGREEGTRLWPEWFTEDMVEQAQRDPRSWISLYQQEPRPAEGAEFKRNWIQRYSTPPKVTNKIILVDPAGDPARSAGKRKKSDFTAMWVVALGSDQNAYLVDGLRDRLNLTQRADALFALHKKHKPMQVRYEQYGLQADVEHVKSEMERRQYRFAIKEVGGGVEKNARIRRLIPWFEGGRMWLPVTMARETVEGKPYDAVADFVEQEYATFPVGRYDDSFDCLARLAEPGMTLPWPSEEQDDDPKMRVWEVLDQTAGW